MQSTRERIQHGNPHVAMHALLVLDACVKNCGHKIHAEVATREFMEEFKKLGIGSQYKDAKADLSRSIASLYDCLAFDTLFLGQHDLFSSFDHYFKLDLTSESKTILLKLPECTVDTVDENDRLLRFIKKTQRS